jgi:hypothetical protein
MSFKYEPNRVKVDKDRIRYDDNKAWKQSCGQNGKGSHIMGFDQGKFRQNVTKIDWSK